jgi:hypothetical protein
MKMSRAEEEYQQAMEEFRNPPWERDIKAGCPWCGAKQVMEADGSTTLQHAETCEYLAFLEEMDPDNYVE